MFILFTREICQILPIKNLLTSLTSQYYYKSKFNISSQILFCQSASHRICTYHLTASPSSAISKFANHKTTRWPPRRCVSHEDITLWWNSIILTLSRAKCVSCEIARVLSKHSHRDLGTTRITIVRTIGFSSRSKCI